MENTAYAVVELRQECNKEKILDDTKLFSTREKALAYLYERYDHYRLWVDAGAGEMSADYSEDGWYEVVDNDGDSYEGYLSECLTIE